MRALAAGRSAVVVGLCSLALAIALFAGAVPARAIVANVRGHGYGITPISQAAGATLAQAYRAQHSATNGSRARRFDEGPLGGSQLESEGGPVMHSATTHVIYWDPASSQFTTTTKAIVGSFFTDVAHDSGLPSNVFAIAGQYTDSSGHAAYSSTFAGALVDGHAYPKTGNCTTPTGVDEGPYASCLFDSQLQTELSTFIAESGLPKGPAQLYFVLLPHNVATCLPEVLSGKQVCSNDFYCAYHSFIAPGTANEIIYADIPFSLLDSSFAKGCQADGNSAIQLPNGDEGTSNTETRFADVALKYISHEYIEAVTDPLVNFDTAWVDEEGLEIGDKCNGIPFTSEEEGEPGFDKNAFKPTLGGSAGAGTLFNQSIDGGSFYLQSEWDNAGEACLMKPLPLSGAAFTPPTSPVAGSAVPFSGSATDPYGAFEPTWTFGDGGTGVGASPTHTYAAAGEYTVTMTPKDGLTGSTAAPVVHNIEVDEAPTASFTISPNPVGEGASVEFDGSGVDPDGSIESYAWNFGDGGLVEGGKTVTHKYAAPGIYTVSLTVTDTGKNTAVATHAVTVDGKPTAATGLASSLAPASATLNATVNPNGADVSECRFEFGTTSSYGSSAPCALDPGSGSVAVAVSATVGSLSESVGYHFRIVAKNSFGTMSGADQAFTTLSGPPQPVVGPMLTSTLAATTSTATVIPNSAFTVAHAAVNARTGVLTFTTSVADPGTFSWLASFQNGRFGAFASASKCKTGFVRLGRKCLPAKIVFAKGSKRVGAPGSVNVMLKPSASALKALKNALRQKKGLPVAIVFSFQSSLGGSAVSHTRSLTVKLKK